MALLVLNLVLVEQVGSAAAALRTERDTVPLSHQSCGGVLNPGRKVSNANK